MKRLAFDLRCLPVDGSSGAGISHAARELFHACVEQSSVFGLECMGYVVGNANIGGKGKVVRVQGSRRQLLKAIRMDGCQAFFAPTGTIPFGVSIPAFAWVHDVAIFYHPEWFPQSWLRRQYTTRLFLHGLQHARHIFCVSEDTRQSVLSFFSRSEREMSVTSEGVLFPDVPREAFSRRMDQVLVFGTVEPRKNIPFLIELWPQVCRRIGRDIPLVIAGTEGWGQVPIPSSPWVRRIKDVSDEQRDRLFQCSRLVLVPSLHEGFGRVALEAMAHGVPVIVSNVGAHPEVVGEAGILLDPQDKQAWVGAICHILTDVCLWREKQEKGRLRAQSFRWDAVAASVLARIVENC